MRIWVKTIIDDKITASTSVELSGKPSNSLLEECVRLACDTLDLPAPMLLKSHFNNFFAFRTVKLLPANFAHSIPFEHFVIEDITED